MPPQVNASLEGLKAAQGMSSTPDMENPASMSEDGTTLFIDKAMFPDGCKEGDTVMIKAQVKSVGSKIGVVPEDIQSEAQEEGQEEGQDNGAEKQY